MDDIVAQAMQKWPDVPDVYGWLSLDRRGNWLLQGERIGNVALNAFIGRNYSADARGRWYFQNGPQRVFVELAVTPFVYSLHRMGGSIAVTAHTGIVAQRVAAAFLTSDSNLLLDTELGPGLILDRDLGIAFDSLQRAGAATATEEDVAALRRGERCDLGIAFDSARLALQSIRTDQIAARFRFDPAPGPPPSNT
jgi:hypothetical protein